MRKLVGKGLLWIALIFAANGISAQCGAPSMPMNEVGVRLGSLSNASTIGGRVVPSEGLHLGYLNGIHYKRYGAVGAFRTSLGLTRYEIEERRNCPNCLRTDGKASAVTLRAGYEWFFVLGVVEPFIGVDAMAVFGNYKSSTWSASDNSYQEFTDTRTRRAMGLSPIAGLRFYLGYAVSLSAETSLDMLFVGRSTTLAQISPETSVFARSNNYFETLYNPVNWLSLNIMF